MEFLFSVGGAVTASAPAKLPVIFDISANNILALATELVLVEGRSITNDDPRSAVSGVSKDSGERGVKRPLDELFPTSRQHPKSNGIDAVRTTIREEKARFKVYVCDLDRPWKLFLVLDSLDTIAALKWSPCGKKLLVCYNGGMFHVLMSKSEALNSWEKIHFGRLFEKSEVSVVHTAWIQPAVQFSVIPMQPLESVFSSDKSTRIVVSPHRPAVDDLPDGFFVISGTGEFISVVFSAGDNYSSKESFAVHRERLSRVDKIFSFADSVFDAVSKCLYIAMGERGSADISCVKGEFLGQNGSLQPVFHHEVFTSPFPALPIKHLCWQRGPKFQSMIFFTKSEENGDTLEIWTFDDNPMVDFHNSFSDDHKINHFLWKKVLEHPFVGEVTFCEQLPQTLYFPESRNVCILALNLAGQEIVLLEVKLDGEMSIEEVTRIYLPVSSEICGHVPERSYGTITSVGFSRNGLCMYGLTANASLLAWRVSPDLWSIIQSKDPTESILTMNCDSTDFFGCLATHSTSEVYFRRLETTYQEMPVSQKRSQATQYVRMKAAFTEKLHGREASFIVINSLFFDAVLSYLEQFMSPEDSGLASVFHIPELQLILERCDVTLEKVVFTVDRQVALDGAAVYLVQTGFSDTLSAMIDFMYICVKYPYVITFAGDAVMKMRWILALFSAWIQNFSFFKQLWCRPAFYVSSFFNVLDKFFEVSTIFLTSHMQENWTDQVKDILCEVTFDSEAYSRRWSGLYLIAESRASMQALVSRPAHFTFDDKYSFLPMSGVDGIDVEKGLNGTAPEQKVFHRKPGKRKFCGRCFFSVPCSSTVNYSGTWLSHIGNRWKSCFCGGCWIILEQQ